MAIQVSTQEERILAAKIVRAMSSGPRQITKDATIAEMGSDGCLIRLPLAAAPTFATMAVSTGIVGDRAHMVPIEVLMSAFNVAPWLQVFAPQRRWRGST